MAYHSRYGRHGVRDENHDWAIHDGVQKRPGTQPFPAGGLAEAPESQAPHGFDVTGTGLLHTTGHSPIEDEKLQALVGPPQPTEQPPYFEEALAGRATEAAAYGESGDASVRNPAWGPDLHAGRPGQDYFEPPVDFADDVDPDWTSGEPY